MGLDNLKVALVQAQIHWHQPASNFKSIADQIFDLVDVDLIVLPEMWSSGFTMKAHQFYKDTDHALGLMKAWSIEKSAMVVGSLITKVDESYFNRLYVIDEGKEKVTYDKRHLFAYSGEDRFFEAGHEQAFYEKEDWKLNLNICYDLRFPVWTRNTSDFDIQIFVANWPAQRMLAWDSLLRARAIENQTYVLGCNCVGQDVWGNSYSGHSSIFQFDGKRLGYSENEASVIEHVLAKKQIQEFRKEKPFLKDRDHFEFKS